MVDFELKRDLDLIAIAKLELGVESSPGLRAGVRLLDTWRGARHGAVLFWVDRDLDLWGLGDAALHHVDCDLVDGAWRSRGAGGAGSFSASTVGVEAGVGVRRLGASSRGPVRLTRAIATPGVSMIELRSHHGVIERPPGMDGFCLFGITQTDPITYARALDAAGDALPGEPILL